MHKKVVLLGSQLSLISKSTLLLLGTMTFQCLGLGVLLGPEHFHRQRAHPSESPFYRWKQAQLLKKKKKVSSAWSWNWPLVVSSHWALQREFLILPVHGPSATWEQVSGERTNRSLEITHQTSFAALCLSDCSGELGQNWKRRIWTPDPASFRVCLPETQGFCSWLDLWAETGYCWCDAIGQGEGDPWGEGSCQVSSATSFNEREPSVAQGTTGAVVLVSSTGPQWGPGGR